MRKIKRLLDLTYRQLEVFRFIMMGMSYDQTAYRLRVHVGTVSRHMNRVYTKLNVDGIYFATRKYKRAMNRHKR